MNIRLLIAPQTSPRVMATTGFVMYRPRETSAAPNYNIVDSEAFSGSPFKGDSYNSTTDASGTIGFEVTVETLKDLLPATAYNLTGATDGNTLAGYTFNEAAVIDPGGAFNKYFTIIEQNLEDNEERIIVGAQFNTVELNVTKSQYVQMNCDIIGFSMDYKDTLGGYTFTVVPDYDKPVTCVTSELYVDSNKLSLDTSSAILNITNNLENGFGLGTDEATARKRTDKISATLDTAYAKYLKDEFKTAWDSLKNSTTVPAAIVMQNGKASGSDVAVLFTHRMKVLNPEFGDKAGAGSLSIQYDVLNDVTKNTPMTFEFGKVD